jgi:hypothetical protein
LAVGRERRIGTSLIRALTSDPVDLGSLGRSNGVSISVSKIRFNPVLLEMPVLRQSAKLPVFRPAHGNSVLHRAGLARPVSLRSALRFAAGVASIARHVENRHRLSGTDDYQQGQHR